MPQVGHLQSDPGKKFNKPVLWPVFSLDQIWSWLNKNSSSYCEIKKVLRTTKKDSDRYLTQFSRAFVNPPSNHPVNILSFPELMQSYVPSQEQTWQPVGHIGSDLGQNYTDLHFDLYLLCTEYELDMVKTEDVNTRQRNCYIRRRQQCIAYDYMPSQ